MNRRLVLVSVAALLLGAGGWAFKVWSARPDPSQMAVFEGLPRPGPAATLTPPAPARISDFERGGPHRLAILVTDPQSGWLGLVRGFRAHGVPITVTSDVDQALTHRVVLAYPIVSGAALTGPEIRKLAAHVRGGGTVVAFNLAGGGLDELFGVTGAREASSRTRLRWAKLSGSPEADEIVVSSRGEARVSSVGYVATSARVAAAFDDGSVAAACRTAGGQACVLGVDLGSLAQRSMNGRAGALSRRYVNGFEPSLDTLFRWLRDVYVAGEPSPWLVSSAPAGKAVSILFTHDVDFGPSIANSLVFARALKSRGLTGTFFVQTKYMKDYNDVAFFNPTTAPEVARLAAMGMDVASHTVAHSKAFDAMPLGSGRERYPTYRPFVETEDKVRGGSILGELRVSKHLLESTSSANVQAFRPGRLSYPFSLPQALHATGYRFSSSVTADTVMTHLPFQLADGRADTALQPVWEFPVTIEDEQPPLMGERIHAADRLIGQIARDRGLVVILTHPNVTDHKLRFMEVIADRWKDRAWIGSVSDFGAWWAARDALELDVAEADGRPVLRARAGAAVKDVAVILPKAGRELTLSLPTGGTTVVALP